MYRGLVSIWCFMIACCLAAGSRSVWDGVYTKAQAARGQAVYAEECMRCHGENLGGGEGGPPLAGKEFLEKWNGKTAGTLFSTIRKTMPSDDPGNLSARQYSDLVAYILSVNEFPAGQKELDRETASLDEIRIEVKR
jgi:S-disulfanyl-L-cysteine oxidoreductase SoxD